MGRRWSRRRSVDPRRDSSGLVVVAAEAGGCRDQDRQHDAVPDSFNINKLFSNRTSSRSTLTDTPQLFYAYRDLDFDGSNYFLARSRVPFRAPSCLRNAVDRGQHGRRDVQQRAGRSRRLPGCRHQTLTPLSGCSTTRFPERITSTSSEAVSRLANEQGTIDGIVRFTTSPSGVNDVVSQVEIYWHPTPPGNATIKRVGILCRHWWIVPEINRRGDSSRRERLHPDPNHQGH